MHILVSTTDRQGTDPSGMEDFCFVPEGELVAMTGFVCHPWTGSCGCGRAFTGLESRKATTTAKVVDSPHTQEWLAEQILASLKAGGWADLADDEDEAAGWAADYAAQLAEMAVRFPEGTVIRRRCLTSDNDPGGLVEEFLAA